MRVGIYARISEDRAGEALGVRDQLRLARAMAGERGWTIALECDDNDLSALTGGPRPGYQRLMAAVKAGQIDRIIIFHPSRLWRNRKERAEGIEVLKKARVNVVCVRGPELDLTTAYGRGTASMLGEVDTMESEIKSERVAAAAERRARAGSNHGGRRAYGFGPIIGTEKRLNRTTKEYEDKPIRDMNALVPEEAEEVRAWCRKILAGVPLGAIVRDLNERGVPTVAGGKWTAGAVRDVLLRPRNAGLSVYRGEVVAKIVDRDGEPLRIVSEDVFRRVETLLRDPSRRTTTGNRASYLLSGIAACGVCGQNITSAGIKRDGTSTRRMYRCRSCFKVNRRADWVDDFVADLVIARLTRPDAADLLVDHDQPDVEQLQTEVLALRERLDDLAAAFADGDITRQQLRTGTERLNAKLKDLEGRMVSVDRAPILDGLVGVENVRQAWNALTLDRQRAVVSTLMQVTILGGGTGVRDFNPDKVQVQWVDPF